MSASTPASRHIWITGAGSGVGEAVALRLARGGHRVVLSGRRADRLADVAERIRSAGGSASIAPVDVADGAEVARVAAAIAADGGPVDALVASAGHNVKGRFWEGFDLPGFVDTVAVNLTGVANCVAAVLPGMRAAGGGQVIVISSRAALLPAPQSGAGYRASKSGAGAVVQTLNGELFAEGIRATHLCPGDIDTEFLDRRPDAPGRAQRSVMLGPDDVALAVEFVVDTPSRIRIDELIVTSSAQW